jgi:hypothetical protein
MKTCLALSVWKLLRVAMQWSPSILLRRAIAELGKSWCKVNWMLCSGLYMFLYKIALIYKLHKCNEEWGQHFATCLRYEETILSGFFLKRGLFPSVPINEHTCLVRERELWIKITVVCHMTSYRIVTPFILMTQSTLIITWTCCATAMCCITN